MSSSDEIRRQLASLRSALRRDAREAAADARTLMDWRHHFRRHPWLCCGAVAAVGYVLVPRRAPQAGALPVAPAAPGMAAAVPGMAAGSPGMAAAPPVVAASGGQPSVAGNLMATALTMAGTALLRYSVARLTERGRHYLEDYLQTADAPHNGTHTRP